MQQHCGALSSVSFSTDFVERGRDDGARDGGRERMGIKIGGGGNRGPNGFLTLALCSICSKFDSMTGYSCATSLPWTATSESAGFSSSWAGSRGFSLRLPLSCGCSWAGDELVLWSTSVVSSVSSFTASGSVSSSFGSAMISACPICSKPDSPCCLSLCSASRRAS